MRFGDVARWSIGRMGFVVSERMKRFLEKLLKNYRFEEMRVPLGVVATDLATGSEVVLNEGDLVEAIRASISVPGIFTPVKKNGGFLLDGGLVNPVPVSAVRNMGADYVIAVNLNHDLVDKRTANSIRPVAPSTKLAVDQLPSKKWGIGRFGNRKLNKFNPPTLSQVRRWMQKDPVPSIFDVIVTSIHIVGVQVTATRLAIDPPDLLIEPKLGDIRFLEFHRAAEAIAEGYREAIAQLEESALLMA
jgi:NTE family protein